MIDQITSLELDLKAFPHKVSAFNGTALVKEWSFASEQEAKASHSSIWKEIVASKLKAKKGKLK